MDRKMISVIIPVYNAEPYLRGTIESVLRQDYAPTEIIVVDDGSTDGSGAIARSFESVRYIYQDNQGQGNARNRGIGEATGELIAFLDSDDLWTEHKLNIQAGFMEEHPRFDFTLTRMHVFLEDGIEWPSSLNKEYYDGDPVGYLPSTLLARRSAFATVGLFSSGYAVSDDSDWFFRANDAGLSMAVIPRVLLYKRIHDKNLTHYAEMVKKDLLLAARLSIRRKRQKVSG